jgi:hypothetical protein
MEVKEEKVLSEPNQAIDCTPQ